MKLLKVIIAVFLAFSVIFTITVGQYKISESALDTSPVEYKGIITVWQVDGFEGGFGSRKQFLLKTARGYEKENQGVLIMVTDYTAEGVKDNLEKGLRPDIISFSNGVEINGFSELNVERSISGGVIGDKLYATAWCRGGYVLIANPELVEEIPNDLDYIESLLVSQGEYTQPLTALAMEGISANKVEIKSPMEAYVKFVSGKVEYFLGTQRDIVRLENRGFDVLSIPLENYNDLYQYVSVTGDNELKRYYAEKFVDYLVSDGVQDKLTEISMLSPYVKLEHSNKHLLAMQELGQSQTISAFIRQDLLKEMQALSTVAVKGDKDALNKIKNMFV